MSYRREKEQVITYHILIKAKGLELVSYMETIQANAILNIYNTLVHSQSVT